MATNQGYPGHAVQPPMQHQGNGLAVAGHIIATGDLGCDGTLGRQRVEIEVVEGNVTASYSPPSSE